MAGPLTYEVPAAFARSAAPGCRARVRVGGRRLVGVILARREAPPEGVVLRPIEAVVDPWPVLPPTLLELAAFVADYYFAPIGEVLRAVMPSDLPPWGDRRVWLTDRGSLAQPVDEEEARIVEVLRERGRIRLAELQEATELDDLPAWVERLSERGRLAVGATPTRGVRYVTAVELGSSPPADLLAACGRSRQGRAVVEYLAAAGRPATLAEVTGEVGCGAGVVRRLLERGVLRSFTQVERLSMAGQALATVPRPAIELRADQREAAERLRAALRERRYTGFLLAGLTGSGKTEVYIRAVEECLAQGRSAIVLVPEIALVPALAGELGDRFGRSLAILHSSLGSSERQQEWERVRGGEARVVLGPRSTVFAPVPSLGLIVVDEEHDASYKQETAPRYHGRDVALARAHREGAVAVLVSATPSLETRENVVRGKLVQLTLHQRVGQGRLPEGVLVDLREEGLSRRPGEVHFSRRLTEELTAVLSAGDQAILLRNRRGYAPLLLCRACGEDQRCPDCGLPRTLHRREGRLRCHICGGAVAVPPACPRCGEAALEPIGAGTERVEEDFARLFPEATASVLDRDAARRRGGARAVLEAFARGDTQVLIGTQMVAKGHHFPRVALTAVLSADTYLGFHDFRAVERTYSLLTQLAGRAGRGERPGRVVIQTYHPDHYAIQAALRHDDAFFAAEETRFRRVFHYPPYSRMAQILVRDRRRERAEERSHELGRALAADPLAREVRVFGPASAPLERLRGEWRFQLLLRGPSGSRLRALLRRALPEPLPPGVVVDIDPYELL